MDQLYPHDKLRIVKRSYDPLTDEVEKFLRSFVRMYMDETKNLSRCGICTWD